VIGHQDPDGLRKSDKCSCASILSPWSLDLAEHEASNAQDRVYYSEFSLVDPSMTGVIRHRTDILPPPLVCYFHATCKQPANRNPPVQQPPNQKPPKPRRGQLRQNQPHVNQRRLQNDDYSNSGGCCSRGTNAACLQFLTASQSVRSGHTSHLGLTLERSRLAFTCGMDGSCQLDF